jgi:hypothetical protein
MTPHLAIITRETESSRQCRIIADGLRGKTDADYPGCTEAELAEKIREVKFRNGNAS